MNSPVDPHVGPSSLDPYLDSLGDPYADPEEPGGRPPAPRAASPGVASSAPRRGSRKELGELDRRKLRAALAEPDLKEKPMADFQDMLGKIDPNFGDYECLTDRQRTYVENVLQELGIDEREPEERNRDVPRGREVAPAWNQGQLPLAPPGRSRTSCLAPPAARFDPKRCSRKLGGTEASCLHCGGECPFPP